MVSHQWEKWYHTIGKNGITPLGLGLGYQKIVGRSVYVRQCFNPERTVPSDSCGKEVARDCNAWGGLTWLLACYGLVMHNVSPSISMPLAIMLVITTATLHTVVEGLYAVHAISCHQLRRAAC
jgi:hypothetical protein